MLQLNCNGYFFYASYGVAPNIALRVYIVLFPILVKLPTGISHY